MEAFSITLVQLAILAVLFLIGYFIRKKDYISDESVRGLSFIFINVCTPAAVIVSMQIEYSRELLLGVATMVFSYIATMLLGYFIALILAKAFNVTGNEKKVWLASGVMFNCLYIGLPITSALYGEMGAFYLCFGLIGWNFMTYSLGIQVFNDEGSKFDLLKLLKKIIRTPTIIGCFVGLALFVLRIKPPAFILKPAEYLGAMSIPASMLVSGAIASRGALREMFTGKNVYIFSIVRLFIIPLAAMVVFSLTIKDPIARNTVVLGSAMPAGTMVPVFAEQFSDCGETGAKYWIVTTILSLLSLPIMSAVISFL